MADIELVIKIPEEDFERCKKRFQMRIDIMGYAIANGTPLPKGHGELIDKDILSKNIIKWLKPAKPDESEMVRLDDIAISVLEEIDEQPTIIKADKEE